MTESTNAEYKYPCENCKHDSSKHTRNDPTKHIANGCTECACESYEKSLTGGRVIALPHNLSDKHLSPRDATGEKK
jgi:hypothetical protein